MDEKDNAQLLGESSLEVDQPPPWPVKVLSSVCWFAFQVACALLLCASNIYLFFPGSTSVARWPVISALLAIILADTAVQRACHAYGYVDLEFETWVPEILDVVSSLSTLAGALVLHFAGSALQLDSPISASRYTDLSRWADVLTRAGAHGLLLLGILKVCTAAFRLSCWRVQRSRSAISNTSSSRNLRIFILVMSAGTSFAFVALVEALVQISATWGILSGFPGPLPTLLTNVLGAITDETQFARVASTGVSDANAGVDSCVRVLSVSRGAWAVQGYPASAADCLTVTSDNGAATGTFCIRHCHVIRYRASSATTGVLLAALLAFIASASYFGHGQVVYPLTRLLRTIVRAASHLDDEGMLTDAGERADVAITAEEAVARVVKGITLLLKASFRGKAVVRRMLQEANKVDREHDVGILDIYGMRNSSRNSVGDAPRSAHSRRSDRDRDSVHDGVTVAVAALPTGAQRVSAPRVTNHDDGSVGGADPGAQPSGNPGSVPGAWRRLRGAPAAWAQGSLHDMPEEFGTLALDVLRMPREHLPDLIVEIFRAMRLLAPRPDPADPLPPRKESRHDRAAIVAAVMEAGGPSAPSGDPERKSLFKREMSRQTTATDNAGGASHTPKQGIFVREDTLRCFIREVEKRYLDNPYHRWEHAVDVTHTTFALLRMATSFRKRHLSRAQLFALLVSAVAHDMGHRGVSNAHLVKTGDILALTYNDASPQENMHVSSLFQLCQKVPEADVFECLPPDAYTEVRKLMIDLILDTDMAAHFHRVAEMEVVLGKAEAAGEGSSSESESGGRRGAVAPAPTAPRMTPEDVRCVLLGLLHAADLGNCVKPIHIHASWSVQVIQEFFNEAQIQKELGMEPVPFMDPEKCFVPTSQMDFLEFIARPLFMALVRLVPELLPLLDNIQRNFRLWAALGVEAREPGDPALEILVSGSAEFFKAARAAARAAAKANSKGSIGAMLTPPYARTQSAKQASAKGAVTDGPSSVFSGATLSAAEGGGAGTKRSALMQQVLELAPVVNDKVEAVLAKSIEDLSGMGLREPPPSVTPGVLADKVAAFLVKTDPSQC